MNKILKISDPAVFDRGRMVESPVHSEDVAEWSPPQRQTTRGMSVTTEGDGPSIRLRLAAQAAWMTSNRYSGQAANDNQDWPLAKLLRTERQDKHLRMAERYRAMYEAATNPVELRGKDLADNIYLMHRMDLDPSTGKLTDKGLKKITGKNARLEEPAKRPAVADPDKTKKRAKPIPKKWDGDWPILHRVDSSRELEQARTALGWLKEPFEAAVCMGMTLEAIGRDHGVGNAAGAKGAGRALVFLGFDAIEQHWNRRVYPIPNANGY